MMMNITDDNPQMEFSADELFPEHSFGLNWDDQDYKSLNWHDQDSFLFDSGFIDELTPEPSTSSEEPFPPLSPPVTPIENSSDDITTNRKEWLVVDQITRRRRPPRLFEFLILLLQKPHYISYASYKDESQRIFEVHQPEKVAALWQQIKNRQSQQEMTYDKFARAIRHYYKDEIMKKTNARFTFQFGPTALKEFNRDENNNNIPVNNFNFN